MIMDMECFDLHQKRSILLLRIFALGKFTFFVFYSKLSIVRFPCLFKEEAFAAFKKYQYQKRQKTRREKEVCT